MMSNAVVPGLTCPVEDTACTVPATLSAAAYRLLRDSYGWDGLIITDTLQTKAVLDGGRMMPEAVVSAIAAGADMVLVKPAGKDPVLADHNDMLGRVRQAVLDWVAEDPTRRTARIERSVQRIRAVKEAIAASAQAGDADDTAAIRAAMQALDVAFEGTDEAAIRSPTTEGHIAIAPIYAGAVDLKE
jgi:beta-glucosidase-like glycosyl hydrolase